MLDQIRRDIQARLQELLGEIDKLRRALAALTSGESGPGGGDHAAPVAGSAAAGESVTNSTRRVSRTRTASVPPRPAPGSPRLAALGVRRSLNVAPQSEEDIPGDLLRRRRRRARDRLRARRA